MDAPPTEPSPALEAGNPASRTGLWLFVTSATALFLELLLIRWAPAVVPFLAYYANLLLISSFLGLGVGSLLARPGRSLFEWFPALLLGDVLYLLACRFTPLPTGGELRFFMSAPRWINAAAAVGVFLLNAALFVPLGERLGSLFQRHRERLGAYAWDLCGSLTGTLVFCAFSVTAFSPVLGLVAVSLAWWVQAGRRARLFGPPVLLAALAAVTQGTAPGALWSPYHHLLVVDEAAPPEETRRPEPPADLATRVDPPVYVVRVNHFFYQRHGTIDPARYTTRRERGGEYRVTYALRPAPRRVLVLGAGGGPDVEAALLAGAQEVVAVDIDPQLIAISRRYSSAQVYANPRVRVEIDDARAYVERSRERFDAVVFGFLDSQGLFSSMANVRLDGFVHTVEGFRAAYERVEEGGVLVLGFNSGGQGWLVHKLWSMVRAATGRVPLAYTRGSAWIFVAPRGEGAVPVGSVEGFDLTEVGEVPIDLARDDWPFLYLHAKGIPWDYLLVIGALALAGTGAVLLALRGKPLRAHGRFFFLGAGFLLLETKSILDCSIYFGSTWLVTTLVVAGVLLMVLLSNAVAARRPGIALRTQYLWLFASLLVVILVPRGHVLAWPFAQRLAWTLLVVPLPVFFAGLIFSLSFRSVADPAACFGMNLIGATLGGLSEYLGMAVGSSGLSVVLLLLYAASAARWEREG